MVRFTTTLLIMLGLALGSTTSVVFSAPLCAAPGETTCGCAKAATASCCSATGFNTTELACCSGSTGSCCSQSSAESDLAGPSCANCSCCVEPLESPIAPATANQTHLPVDLLTWSAPLNLELASPAISSCERAELHSGQFTSLQVLHCRWLN